MPASGTIGPEVSSGTRLNAARPVRVPGVNVDTGVEMAVAKARRECGGRGEVEKDEVGAGAVR